MRDRDGRSTVRRHAVDRMSDETKLLTYPELCVALGRSEVATRSLVARRRWRRVRANDGTIRIEVPVELLERLQRRSLQRQRSTDDPSTDASTTPPGDDRPIVAMLQARVGE